MPRERRDGGLSVGAGDREHGRGIRPREELHVADDRNAPSRSLHHHGLLERQARAYADEAHPVEKLRCEGTGVQFAAVVPGARRRGAGIGDARHAAVTHDPARDRKPGVAQSEDQHPLPGERKGMLAHHLSLRVESPKSTSIMVMIQKRTTTWLSFQPSSS